MKTQISWKAVSKNTLTRQLEVNEALCWHPLNTDEGFIVLLSDGTTLFKTFDESFLYRDDPDEGDFINLC